MLNTAESHSFPESQNFCELFCTKANFFTVKSGKVLTCRDLSSGKFQYTAESQNLTFKRPVTTSKANFQQNQPWVISTTLDLEEKT
jgi:hypothetical protein